MASRVQCLSVAILLLILDCVLSYLTSLDVAQCRVGCLPDDDTTPVNIPHHDECWNTCSLLYAGETNICNQSSNCGFGCKLACRIYYMKEYKPLHFTFASPRSLSSHNPIKLVFTPPELLADWSQKAEGSRNTVYTLLKYKDDKWATVTQTTTTNCTLNKDELGSYLKLVAVDRSGIVGETVITNLENATLSELLVSWKPTLIYFRNGGSDKGAEATIHWPTFEKSKKCEVIWMLMNRNIEITGHLYSEGNVASLTLWTNSVYSVQIKCYDQDQLLYAYSDPLTLNTYGIEAEEKRCSISFDSLSFVIFCCYFIVVGGLISIFVSSGYYLQKDRKGKKIVRRAHISSSDKKTADFGNPLPILSNITLPASTKHKIKSPCK